MAFLWTVLGACLVLALLWLGNRFMGFGAQRPEDYAQAGGEAFDLRRHLDGPLVCDGVIYGPTGRVVSRFTGDFDVRWDGDSGVMTEVFHYESGKIQHREWRLTLNPDGQITALADDIAGEGRGWQSGPAVLLRYRIRLEEDSGGHVLDATDWMYLTPAGTIVNRSRFRKFGITVAELVATMRRKEAL